MHRAPFRHVLAVALLLSVYVYGLWRTGVMEPDEPRYASIGRAMATTGDWITPRLWGEPWFEKPALLYWLIAAGYKAGFGDDLAPRLPIALVSASFLYFYFRQLRREFGGDAAFFSAAILATSAGWLAFSHVAVTDLPLAAAFSTAVLLCLPWVRCGGRRGLFIAGLFLGLAVLAKGLVPLVLIAPVAWVGRKRFRDLLFLGAACLLVAAPWYLLCWRANGAAFIDEFFWRHHFGRFVSPELQHVQPWWFYLPVFIGLLIPWAPALAGTFRREIWRDVRTWFLALIVLFGFVFFSASTNKLPGYVLPLLPSAAALMGKGLADVVNARWMLAGSGLLLATVSVAAGVLPLALANGLGRTGFAFDPGGAGLGVGFALFCWVLERSKHRFAAVMVVACAMLLSVVAIKIWVYPRIDESTSPRGLWRQVAGRDVCVSGLHRTWLYGLQFYAGRTLPDCRDHPADVRLIGDEGNRPRLETATVP